MERKRRKESPHTEQCVKKSKEQRVEGKFQKLTSRSKLTRKKNPKIANATGIRVESTEIQ